MIEQVKNLLGHYFDSVMYNTLNDGSKEIILTTLNVHDYIVNHNLDGHYKIVRKLEEDNENLATWEVKKL